MFKTARYPVQEKQSVYATKKHWSCTQWRKKKNILPTAVCINCSTELIRNDDNVWCETHSDCVCVRARVCVCEWVLAIELVGFGAYMYTCVWEFASANFQLMECVGLRWWKRAKRYKIRTYPFKCERFSFGFFAIFHTEPSKHIRKCTNFVLGHTVTVSGYVYIRPTVQIPPSNLSKPSKFLSRFWLLCAFHLFHVFILLCFDSFLLALICWPLFFPNILDHRHVLNDVCFFFFRWLAAIGHIR